VSAVIVGLVAFACLAGCSRDDADEAFPEKEPTVGQEPVGMAFLRLRINLSKGGIPTGTRADAEEVADSLPGEGYENTINKLDLLVFDAESDLLRQIVPVENVQSTEKENIYKVSVPVFADKNKKLHIYAVANLPDNMRDRLSPGLSSKCSFFSTREDYRSLMNELMPGSNGKEEDLKATGIPMTGQLKMPVANNPEGNPDIVFTEANQSESKALEVTANLCRMVAKVHVVAKTKSFELSSGKLMEYVEAVDPKTPSTMSSDPGDPIDPTDPVEGSKQWIGWIRKDSVRYILNGVNKSTYLFPQPTGSTTEYPRFQDCNMNLDSYVVGGGFDQTLWERDYCFLQRADLHDKNINESERMSQVETYDPKKLSQGTTDPYVKGMYCLENYFNKPQQNTEIFDRYEGRSGTDIMPGENANAIPMVTHVFVAAKLTPRYIVVVGEYLQRMNELVTTFQDTDSDTFCKEYKVKPEDFTDKDVDRWNALKEWDESDAGKAAGGPYFSGEGSVYRNDFRIIKTRTEQDAADIIKWSLIANKLWGGNASGIEDDKCPAGTFYVYDTNFDSVHILESQWDQRYLYLTAGAVAAAKGDNMRIKIYSVPHLGGWGYYYTYIDQTRDPYYDQNGQIVRNRAPYTASQVTRNTYYVLTINNFGGPGGAITSPEFIKINTEPISWDYGGRGDINLY